MSGADADPALGLGSTSMLVAVPGFGAASATLPPEVLLPPLPLLASPAPPPATAATPWPALGPCSDRIPARAYSPNHCHRHRSRRARTLPHHPTQ
eukprot:ctg_341.g107